MYPFSYKILFWDECDEKETTKTGFFYAVDFEGAMHKLADYYGKNNLMNVQLQCYQDGPFEVPEDILTSFIDHRENDY